MPAPCTLLPGVWPAAVPVLHCMEYTHLCTCAMHATMLTCFKPSTLCRSSSLEAVTSCFNSSKESDVVLIMHRWHPQQRVPLRLLLCLQMRTSTFRLAVLVCASPCPDVDGMPCKQSGSNQIGWLPSTC